MALLFTALLPTVAAERVLQLYGTNAVELTIENGVWSKVGDFANNRNSYGGRKNSFKGLASDGRSVFIGEHSGDARILEFDMQGNFRRVLVDQDGNVEHMAVSRDGLWLYANINPNFSQATTNAVVHRYSTVTGEGGLFIDNSGTNTLGEVLWKFQIHRGICEDEYGNLWVSERSNGTAYKFSAVDGSYLGKVTNMGGVQGLFYDDITQKLYCTSMGDNTWLVDVLNDTREVRAISDAMNRLGMTRLGDQLIGARVQDGDIAAYDFVNLSYTILFDQPIESREIITLPSAPLRPKIGELLISETISNRVMRVSFDTANAYDVEENYFAGGEGVNYNGAPLREPRGLATHSNTVYVAEGVAGGRILKFSKWGTFKAVAFDFSQSAYSDCVPAALALTPDGRSLYVTDAHTIYIQNNGTKWSNAMPVDYLDTHTYGSAIYKISLLNRTAAVFVDDSSLPSGNQLIEPRGVAVDGEGNVYFSSWYNDPTQLYDATGRVYYSNPAGEIQGNKELGNPSIFYYDPIGVYDPPAGNSAITGAGLILSGFGIQDIFWAPEQTVPSAAKKLLDNTPWHTYLDVEVINGRVYYTDPVFGILRRRTGDELQAVELSGLAAPTYMVFADVIGEEPPVPGTMMTVR
jgi:hypothetical protein